MEICMSLASDINEALETSTLLSFVGGSITLQQLKDEFDKIAKPFNARVKILKIPKKLEGSDRSLLKRRKQYHISAEYTYDKKKYPIIIYFKFHPDATQLIFTKQLANDFLFRFSQTLQHECVHQDQEHHKTGAMAKTVNVQYSSNLGRERKEYIQYYTNGEELAAFAHDLALEMKQFYPMVSVSKLFQHPDQYRKLRVYHAYRDTFRNMDWEVLKKALLKKTYHWFPTVEPVFRIP